MRLNGWQRLWFVLSALWLACVLAVGFASWPSRTDVSAEAVYAEMPVSSLRLQSAYLPERRPLLADGRDGQVSAFPPDATDEQLRAFLREHLVAQPSGQKLITTPAGKRVSFPSNVSESEIVSALKENGMLAQPENWFDAHAPQPKTTSPLTVLKAGKSELQRGDLLLEFWSGVSDADAARVIQEHETAVARVLHQLRLSLAGRLALIWTLPAFTVYLLGIATAWVRAGFRSPSPR